MNDMLSKQELDWVLYELTKGQSYVKTTVAQYASQLASDVSWWLNHGDIWWETIHIRQMPDEERFPFHVAKFTIHDVDDGRLDKVLCHYADYIDDFGYSFTSKENLIKAIQTFTIVLIKNWN